MIRYHSFCFNCENRGKKCNMCEVDEPYDLICDHCGCMAEELYTVKDDPDQGQYCYQCAHEKAMKIIACNEDEADSYISSFEAEA